MSSRAHLSLKSRTLFNVTNIMFISTMPYNPDTQLNPQASLSLVTFHKNVPIPKPKSIYIIRVKRINTFLPRQHNPITTNTCVHRALIQLRLLKHQQRGAVRPHWDWTSSAPSDRGSMRELWKAPVRPVAPLWVAQYALVKVLIFRL